MGVGPQRLLSHRATTAPSSRNERKVCSSVEHQTSGAGHALGRMVHSMITQSSSGEVNVDECICVSVGHTYLETYTITSASAKRETEGFGAAGEELDLEPPAADRSRLTDQLIHPLLHNRAVAVGVDVCPTR